MRRENLKYGVFTTNKEWAKSWIDTRRFFAQKDGAKVEQHKNSANELVYYLDNGDVYMWVRPTENSRGRRFTDAVVDISTCPLEIITHIIVPIVANRNNITIAESETEERMLFSFIEQLQKVASIKGDMPMYYEGYNIIDRNIRIDACCDETILGG